MLKLALLCIIVGLVLSQNPCEPFGLRIYYGDVVTDINSQDKLSIYFNTRLSCPDSYVTVISTLGYKNIPCTTKTIVTSNFMNNYVAYIHVCSTADVPFEQAISYTAYGWDSKITLNAIPFKEQWIDIKLIDPRVVSRSLKMIVMADWGVIEHNNFTPITSYLKQYLRNNQVNGVMVIGDIAYDLDTQNGRIYEDFLGLLQEFSTRLPFFFTPGNHERKTVDAAYLFNQTFKVYGVDKTLATGIYFGSLFLAMFDPFNLIYNKTEPISSLEALKAQLAKGVQSKRFIIPYSHYPLQCSAQQEQCTEGYGVLKPHFEAMLDNGVSLYIGAHSHVYQRLFPYYRDGTFGNQPPPYVAGGQYLISVVEGVAGSNRTIITDIPLLESFTAMFTVNETGFAVLESTPGFVSYQHYSTKRGFIDQFYINLPFSHDQNIQQEKDSQLKFEVQ